MTAPERDPRDPGAPASDDMDVHSDSGLDFDDADIDLDLAPPAPAPTPGQDGAMTTSDAVSAIALDAQAVPGDQDDYMADPDDFIEEDYVYQDEDIAITTAPPSESTPITAKAPSLAPPDEDLLDYSDDDHDEQTQENHTWLSEHEQTEAEQTEAPQTKLEPSTAQQLDDQDSAQSFASAGDETSDQQTQHGQDYVKVSRSVSAAEPDAHSQASIHDDNHSEAYNEEEDHTDGEVDGHVLQENEIFAGDDENEHSEHGISNGDRDDADAAADDEHQDHESSNLWPITVNYAGNELWLFKQHDPDDTCDWLLDDMSVLKLSMSDLFQACRVSLGDDVSNQYEIGFRFDHLHNLELYEDNTACVAVSLERLVSLYYTLHAQDGNNNPDSFYCSLLFRPRFATQLSDIAKYADQGSGYSGLDAAVVAGETHFSNLSTEHELTGDQEEVDREYSGSVDDATHQELHQGVYEDYEQHDAHTELEEVQDSGENDEQENEGASPASMPYQAQHPSEVVDVESPENTNANVVLTDQQEESVVSQTHDETAAESDARREQNEDDLLDYSDDDDFEKNKHADANEPSPSSTTVQGDEAAATTAEDCEVAPDHNGEVAAHQDGQVYDNTEEFDFHVDDENDNQFNDQLLDGIDDTAQSYQNYPQVYDQDDPFQDFQAGDANQEYAGYEYQDLDEQLPPDFMKGADFNPGDDSTTALNDLGAGDDFLDLDDNADDNADEWVTEQEPTSKLPQESTSKLLEEPTSKLPEDDDTLSYDDATVVDKEDDVVEQAAAAVSSVADPTTALSTEIKNVSHKGTKRSVDDAGHGADSALDSIDAKRPRV